MIYCYHVADDAIIRHGIDFADPSKSVWIDINSPSAQEKELLISKLGIPIPSVSEIDDIEVSHRFFNDDDTYHLTTSMISYDENGNVVAEYVKFVLLKSMLVTIRYADIYQFSADKFEPDNKSKIPLQEQILLFLMRNSVYQIADALEYVGLEIDTQSKQVFSTNKEKSESLEKLIQNIARCGDSTAKAKDILINTDRMMTHLMQHYEPIVVNHAVYDGYLKILRRDVQALSDHAFFLSNQISFTLNTTLGLINIEQNYSIRVFSMVSMLLLPSTLIASIYGMNFKNIPGLSSDYGYLIAVGLMIASIAIPYRFFKKKGWF